MAVVRILALCWLVLVAGFLYGAWAVKEGLWPWPAIAEFEAWIAGHEEEDTSLTEKVQNDLGVKPSRHLVPVGSMLAPIVYRQLDGLPLNDDRTPPEFFLSDGAPRGYRVIYGVFDFADKLHGAVLLDPDGRVQQTWQVTQENTDWNHSPDRLVFPHGFDITRDGSILVAFDGGTSMAKYSYCGKELWRLKGGFHHSIELDDDGNFWVWGNDGVPKAGGLSMHKIRASDGTILNTITMNDQIKANAHIDIFGLRQYDSEEGARWAIEGGGAFHQNDIDPLSATLAPHYGQFEVGDLLISMRSINLVYVLDPDTVKVKWWRIGIGRRQHDPDWNPDGTITILNNNMHRGYSHIEEVDPATMKIRRLLDGRQFDFYTWHRGKHQRLPDGGLLVTSSEQGRAFEASPEGQVRFDFHNTYGKGESLVLSEARFLPVDYFDEVPECKSCSTPPCLPD